MSAYGLLGRNIGYSFSKNYFSEKFIKENIESTYQNFDIETIDVIRNVIQTPNLKGFNITIPYKQEIIPFLHSIDPIAQKIGAVNVVKVDENQKMTGYNSDYYGFSESLKPFLQPEINKALILGTGGASKAIAYALDRLDIQHKFVSRNPDLDQFCYSDLDEDIINSYKLIINCTPLGTYPNIENYPDIPYEYLGDHHVLYDLIYNPEETAFMKKGKLKGAKVSNGLQMLILQAEKSWEIWNA